MKEYNIKLTLEEMELIDSLIDYKILNMKIEVFEDIDKVDELYSLANKLRGFVDSER